MSNTTWQINQPKYPALKENLSADVVIVGGGLAGVFCAYELSKRGIETILLEAKTLGGGATMQTTAFITQDIDTDLSDLVSMFGPKKAKLVWESGQAAIKKIATIVEEENIDCEFTYCPLYIFANEEKDYKMLQEEKAAADSLGFKTSLVKKLPRFPNAGAWAILDQAKFHPLKFLNGLAQKAAGAGVKIFENTEVVDVEYGKRAEIKTKHFSVSAKNIILATYDPLGNPIQTKFKKGMYVSYILELELPKGTSLEEAIYLDTQNPYHYFRVDGNRVILGGEDNRKEVPVDEQKHFSALKDFAQKTFGKDFKIIRQWTGPILEPSDGLALIGQYKENAYVACTFSGNGMTYSAISAMLIGDLIQQKKNAWESLYDPKRIPTIKQLAKKAKDYTEELIQGTFKTSLQY
jgi:glycine/D-amino acid oxidase-like deaminating enzyme